MKVLASIHSVSLEQRFPAYAPRTFFQALDMKVSGNEYGQYYLLGSETVYSGKNLLILQRNVLAASRRVSKSTR
jgi:hypothetical protein